MTNAEKFKEVFGFTPDSCPLPPKIVCRDFDFNCNKCPFHDFWNKEYRSCFRLKEESEK